MDWNTWALFAATTLALTASPGPSALLALSHGSRHGARRTSATVAGSLAAFALMLAVSLAGVGAVLAASAGAFQALKLAGAAYLVYVGVKTWRVAGRHAAPETDVAREPAPVGARSRFWSGFAVAASNPRVLVFSAAYFPQFIAPDGPYLLQVAVLAATFLGLEATWQAVYAGAGGQLASWLSRPVIRRRFDRATGGMFVGLGVALAASSRR